MAFRERRQISPARREPPQVTGCTGDHGQRPAFARRPRSARGAAWDRGQCPAFAWERSTSTTATMTSAPPSIIGTVTVSPSNDVPRITAMIGLTYA